MIKKRIVAEVSKTWWTGCTEGGLLAEKFEEVIQVNAERGYTLESWRMTSVSNETKNNLIETIVAVFVEVGP